MTDLKRYCIWTMKDTKTSSVKQEKRQKRAWDPLCTLVTPPHGHQAQSRSKSLPQWSIPRLHSTHTQHINLHSPGNRLSQLSPDWGASRMQDFMLKSGQFQAKQDNWSQCAWVKHKNTRLYTSVSLLLSRTQGYCYHGLCGRGRGWEDLGEWHWNM